MLREYTDKCKKNTYQITDKNGIALRPIASYNKIEHCQGMTVKLSRPLGIKFSYYFQQNQKFGFFRNPAPLLWSYTDWITEIPLYYALIHLINLKKIILEGLTN